MNDESQLALVRFDFTSGALRGSQLMLYPRCLVHRSDSHLETMPLARVTALKVSFEREPRRLGWGVALVIAALLLLAANVFYAFAYDTEYAMVDRDDDAKLGIRTSALTLGRWDVAGVMTSYALMLVLLAALGALRGLAWPYYAGLAAAGAMMLYHWTLIRSRGREGCFRAFRHNNWVGGVIFLGIAASLALA